VAVNVILALCGSTLATYAATMALRRSIGIADIANAALAGGVAIGATCDFATSTQAILIGILAGTISTFGFAVVQGGLQDRLRSVDTCGVTNLHGWPGLMGGLAALFVVAEIDANTQVTGIAITVGIAIGAGFITGLVLSAFGRRETPYDDIEEILEAKEQAES
jgi:ammonium transporter Rh